MKLISLYEWFDGGVFWIHSRWVDLFVLRVIIRLEEIASHRIRLNIITAINDVYLPKEEIIFHAVKASG